MTKEPDPAAVLSQIRRAVLAALPVDEAAEAEFDRWLAEHTPPAKGHRIIPRAQKGQRLLLGE